jgi:hypothetical protein
VRDPPAHASAANAGFVALQMTGQVSCNDLASIAANTWLTLDVAVGSGRNPTECAGRVDAQWTKTADDPDSSTYQLFHARGARTYQL